MNEPQQQAQAPSAKVEDALPLPKFLMRIYYIFPIILYLPDVIFNFYVYSNGLLKTTQFPDVLFNIEFYLWAFLATGIVGMAWLLSVLAPWHWARGNRFQSVMCWFGVVIATAITTWNSMSFRFDQKTTDFQTDQWFSQIFNVHLNHFSPTVVLVSLSPPFWGLFWAIVQPAERRRNASEQAEEFELKKLRMQQEAELKKMRAEANAQVRGAQLAGLAASMKAARSQIGAAITSADAPPADTTIIVEADATLPPALLATAAVTTSETPTNAGAPASSTDPDRAPRGEPKQALPKGEAFVALVSQTRQALQSQQQDASWQNISTEIERAGYVTPDRVEIARALRTIGDQLSGKTPPAPPAARKPPLPIVGSAGFDRLLIKTIDEITADGTPPTAREVANRTGYQFEDVSASFARIMSERQPAVR